ncbi:MAG: regulator [Acidithiobacillales bacterium SM23_46]|jgi:DNA-binding response OmpR family regulator|nr:MAG: regulator [Thiotrichales bacterium SG8_50]KPK68649.1 MAG: regulator [Acidithiobacillales bacterium SM23_46]KPL27052.1 MAG: regulator [Acidithiobacillales bacterium SM1_46]
MRILIVEDDHSLGEAFRVGLRQQGFETDWVRDGIAAAHALKTEPYSAVVLDLGLPRLEGLELLRRLRAAGNKVPVVIVTARDPIEDRVRGLDTGADDYIVKPVDLQELAARLRALARRAHGEADPVLRMGDLSLEPAAHRVTFRGQTVELQAREFALLQELMVNAGRVLSREQLERRLYAWGEEVASNAVEVHIHHLRRKLAPHLIRTVRGVGYLMPRDAHD